jgi:uncharacterized membrane protein
LGYRQWRRGEKGMRSMRRSLPGLMLGLVILFNPAQAEVTFEIICLGGACDISADGTVVVGNTDGAYETFRWTRETGRVLLGRATVPVLGKGAGTPDVSADGTRISATILGEDSTYATQGLWTQGVGWRELIPPTLPDGGIMDQSYGSAWGLSDDGGMVTGLYWRPGATDGSAHASMWTDSTGLVSLGSSNGASRANDANYDGSVIVGWEENPVFGNWWPAVWVDGVKTILSTPDAFTEAAAVNPAGTIVVGQGYDDSTDHHHAAAWRWNGSVWEEELLGFLRGTHPYAGTVIANDLKADGSLIVGYNAFDYAQATGFMWTEETGMIDVEDYLIDNGVTLDPMFDIRSLTAVSDDGTVMVGMGQDMVYPYTIRSFMISILPDAAVPGEPKGPEVVSRLRILANPTRDRTSFVLSMPKSASVSLDVYDITGRLVRRVLAGTLSAGDHEVEWDGRDVWGVKVAPGAYVVRLSTADWSETGKVLRLR